MGADPGSRTARDSGGPKVAARMGLSQNRRRLIGRLRIRRQRERERSVLVEGLRAVNDALDAGADATFAVVTPALLANAVATDLVSRLRSCCDTTEVTDEEFAKLADTDHPQGVLLVCRQPAPDIGSIPGEGALLVVDGVQDPGNLGTLVRSAVAFALDGVIVLDGTSDPWGPKAVRASAGTVFRIPIWSATLSDAIEVLTTRGAEVLVASGEGRPAASCLSFDTPLSALVLGNEGAGVRAELRQIARDTVAVPMKGTAESLNVGVAGSILMYEWTR